MFKRLNGLIDEGDLFNSISPSTPFCKDLELPFNCEFSLLDFPFWLSQPA